MRSLQAETLESRIRYNFGSDSVDSVCIDLKIWRRHIRDVLTRQEVLTSYGDPQGEPALREALSSYCYGVRGVKASPDRSWLVRVPSRFYIYSVACFRKKQSRWTSAAFPKRNVFLRTAVSQFTPAGRSGRHSYGCIGSQRRSCCLGAALSQRSKWNRNAYESTLCPPGMGKGSSSSGH